MVLDTGGVNPEPNHSPLPVHLLLAVTVTALMAGALFCAPPTARAGEYAVQVPGTTGFPGWWTPWAGTGQYRAGNGYVDTSAGSYVVGSYLRWRLDAPQDVRMVGGRIEIRSYTPNDAFLAHVRQGAGAAVATVLATTANGVAAQTLGSADWLDVGLEAQRSTTTQEHAGNRVTITSLSVTLSDGIDPEIVSVTAPDASGWHGGGCLRFAWSETDRGSGIASSSLRNETTGATLAQWNEAARPGLAPGSPAQSRTTCVRGSEQTHGSNAFAIVTRDWSGRTRRLSMPTRIDLRPPQLSGVPRQGAILSSDASLTVSAMDAESGLERVEAWFDGQPASVRPAGSTTFAITPGRELASGQHDLRLVIRDRAGNVTNTRVWVQVNDATGPEIRWLAPTTAGGPSPVVEAAADDQSRIDPGSWRLLVNGHPVHAQGSPTRLEVAIGPLAHGRHRLELSVSDVHGNRTTASRDYEVRGTTSFAVGAGSRTGVFVGSRPEGVLRWAEPVKIRAVVVDRGRPLAGTRVQLRQGARVLAQATADVTGSVELHTAGMLPGTLEVVADAGVPSAQLNLRVAPVVSIRVRTGRPLVGQRVPVHGRVLPGLSGHRLVLEAGIGGSWYPVRKRIVVGRRGKWRSEVTSATAGDVAIRARLAARDGWSEGISRAVVLRVRQPRMGKGMR